MSSTCSMLTDLSCFASDLFTAFIESNGGAAYDRASCANIACSVSSWALLGAQPSAIPLAALLFFRPPPMPPPRDHLQDGPQPSLPPGARQGLQKGSPPAPAAHPGGVLGGWFAHSATVQVKLQLLSHGFAGSHPLVRTCVQNFLLPQVFDRSVRMYNQTKDFKTWK